MNDITALAQIIDIAGNLSVVGLLFLLVLAFYQGKVIPRSVMDQMLDEAENRTTKLAKELLKAMKTEVQHAVQDGIRESKE